MRSVRTAADRALADRPAQWRGAGWWTPAVTVAAIGPTALFARLSLARLRFGPARHLALPSPGRTARRQAPAEALTARVVALPWIADGHGRGRPPTLDPRVPPQPYTVRTSIRPSAASPPTPHVC
jgi:hypothetical protein